MGRSDPNRRKVATLSRQPLRASLRANETLLASFQLIPRLEIIELLGLAGFDAVIIDLEHGPIGIPDLPSLASAANSAGVHSIVRLRGSESVDISSALDSGVDAVMVPHVSSKQIAVATVKFARFPPEGVRSLNPYVRGVAYNAEDPARLAEANAGVAVIGMIEGTEGLHNLESILQTDGLDAIFVGPVDLSAALGSPGQPEHPEVVERIEGIMESARSQGVATGIYAPTANAARRWLSLGASLVAVSADISMLHGSFRSMRMAIDGPPPESHQRIGSDLD